MPRTLSTAAGRLAYARSSHGYPSQALAVIYMIDGWIEAIPFRPNPFSDIGADAALATSLTAALGPPPRDSGVAPGPGGDNREKVALALMVPSGLG